jgi:hypothetical protein
MLQDILENSTNIFGKLSPNIVMRIKEYIKNPTVDGWDDIQTIIIRGKDFFTIWQAVIQFDPTFPQTGRTTDEDENIIKEWERIPTEFEVLRAIQMATESE